LTLHTVRTKVIGSSQVNNDITLDPINSGFNTDDYNIRWSPSDNLDVSNIFEPVILGGIGDVESAPFTATISNECYSITLTRIVEVLSMPNIFSPNGDMQNATFNILGDYNPDDIASFKVFNRWGQIVYDNENPANGWDGRFNDEDQPVDVYVYIVELTSGDKISGDVTLLR